MRESDAAEICAIIARWCALNGRSVRLLLGDRIRLLEYNESIKPFLARHGYAVVDGYVCEEARWKRT